MSTLIIVHVEPDFEQAGCTVEFAHQVSLYAKKFKHVINVVSCQVLGGEEYQCLSDYKKEDWIWGYDAEYYKEDPETKHVEGIDYIRTTGHEYSLIEPWMKDLSSKEKYVLIGGCRNECLQDVREIFDHLKLKYRLQEEYIYG